MERLSGDDEIHYYIAALNTVIANKGIASNPEVITKIIFSSQNKTLLLKANHKKDYSYLSDQLVQSKFYLTIFYGGTMIKIKVFSVSGFVLFVSHRLSCDRN